MAGMTAYRKKLKLTYGKEPDTALLLIAEV